MTTARKQARDAATKNRTSITYDTASQSADAASDIWEPIVQALVENGPHGHLFAPISEKDVESIQRYNDSEYREKNKRSLRCWNCNDLGDRRVSPDSDKTWGDVYHQSWEAWKAAKDALDDNG